MKFVFTCGGTAGFINPRSRSRDGCAAAARFGNALFIGAEGKMEMELSAARGLPHRG